MVSLLICCALITLLTTVGIIYMLIKESAGFFYGENINFWDFLTGTKWSVGRTQGDTFDYGIWPLLSGTLRITVIAMALALPLGLITAIYLSEYAPKGVRAILKPTLEIIAGIPTVVLGFFAVKFITPNLLAPLGNLAQLDENFRTFNAAAAGIAVGILCIPLVASFREPSAITRSMPWPLSCS